MFLHLTRWLFPHNPSVRQCRDTALNYLGPAGIRILEWIALLILILVVTIFLMINTKSTGTVIDDHHEMDTLILHSEHEMTIDDSTPNAIPNRIDVVVRKECGIENPIDLRGFLTDPFLEYFEHRVPMSINRTYPLGYGFPAFKMNLDSSKYTLSRQKKTLSVIVPSDHNSQSVTFDTEQAYYEEYSSSFFAFTFKKAGWECMRHYEIMSNGAIPLFLDIAHCPEHAVVSLPKQLLQCINKVVHSILDIADQDPKDREQRKFEIQQIQRESSSPDKAMQMKAVYDYFSPTLHRYTEQFMSTKSAATNFLRVMERSIDRPIKRVLILDAVSTEKTGTCYQSDLLLSGLNEVSSLEFVVDFPRKNWNYKDFKGNSYGNCFTFCRLITDSEKAAAVRNEDSITRMIEEHEFDVIVYARMSQAIWDYRDEPGTVEKRIERFSLWSHIKASYTRNEIAFLFGGDSGCCTRNIIEPFTSLGVGFASNLDV